MATLDCTFKKLQVDVNSFGTIPTYQNTDTGAWTVLYTAAATWRFDQVGITPKLLNCSFEEYPEDIEIFTGGEDDGSRTGDINCDHDPAIYALYDTVELFTGTFTTAPITADMDCDHDPAIYALYDTVELFTGTYTAPVGITGDIDCAFEWWVMQGQTGLHMGLTMLTFGFYSYTQGQVMSDINIEFSAPDCFMIGFAQFNSINTSFMRFEVEGYTGAYIEGLGEDWTYSSVGIAGFVGDIDATMQRFTVSLLGGYPAYIDAAFESFDFSSIAYGDYLAMLDLVMRMPTIELTGDTPIVAHLDGRFLPVRVNFYAESAMYLVGNLDVIFRQIQVNLTGIKGLTASLAVQLDRIRLEMNAVVDGPNGIDLVFREPEMYLSLPEEDCDIAETLTF